VGAIWRYAVNTACGLYDGTGAPLYGAPDAPIRWAALGFCRMAFDPDKHPEWSGGSVDRQWILPRGASPLPVADEVLADLVATLDGGGIIAVLADDADAIDAALDTVFALAGGWHA